MTVNPKDLTLEMVQQMEQGYCFVPILTKAKMATHTGLREGQIYSMLNKRTLPSYTIGRVQLVNLAIIAEQRNSIAPIPVPFITKGKFCELVGLTEGQLLGWIHRGYIPTMKKGRHRFVDLLGLFSQCAGKPVEFLGS